MKMQLVAAATRSQEVMMDLRGVVYGGINTARQFEDNAQVIFDHAGGSPYFEELAAEAYAIGVAARVTVEDLEDVLVVAEVNICRQERWGGVSVR